MKMTVKAPDGENQQSQTATATPVKDTGFSHIELPTISNEQHETAHTDLKSLEESTEQDAQRAADKERADGFWHALKQHPKAVFWSAAISAALIMEGYDKALIGAFYAQPAFKQRYGVYLPDKGDFEIPAAWQAGLTNGARAGEIIGLFINGYISEAIGYRYTFMASLAAMTMLIFIPFFAPSLAVLQLGQVLIGIPWGVFQTLTTTYASDVCPVALRAYLTTYVNLCWVFGQLIASGVQRGFVTRMDEWAYRIPFGLQWMWPLPLCVLGYLAPESPWWLVRHGKEEAALASLKRLTVNKGEDELLDTIAMMKQTNDAEAEVSAGSSYLDCFKSSNLRRTEITCAVWSIQNLCGNVLMGYSTYFFIQAGFPAEQSYDLTIAQYGLAIFGTMSTWLTMAKLGRRTLYVCGLALLCGLLLTIGGLSLAPGENPGARWALAAFLLVYVFCYDCSVGPVCYALVAEMPSTRLRIKTVVMARACFNFWGIFNGVITPYMLNPSAWDWGAKTAFFWAGVCFLCLIWTYFRLPEPKGRTYGELDELFKQKVSARKFKETKLAHSRGI